MPKYTEQEINELEMCEVMQEFRDQKGIHCVEGSSGVKKLGIILKTLGYTDRFGSIVEDFLEDNSGCIEAIITWIEENGDGGEWQEAIANECECHDEESEDEDGEKSDDVILERLQTIADEVDGTLRANYSGRGMFGRECYGITCRNINACIEAAAKHGVTGAKTDNMGKDYIVYWEHLVAPKST